MEIYDGYISTFGFGAGFIKWLEIMYAHPAAFIITNQDVSNSFQLFHGTRQGYAPYPLFYMQFLWNH